MCSIFGALIWSTSSFRVTVANNVIDHIMTKSLDRGRDGWGYHVHEEPSEMRGCNYEERSVVRNSRWPGTKFFNPSANLDAAVMIGNMRAEPTTEFVAEKRAFDQQPYRNGSWTIVHNGTIANDKQLRTHELPTTVDSAAIVEALAAYDDDDKTEEEVQVAFRTVIAQLRGSYAILAVHNAHPDMILVACNYRPIWYAKSNNSVYFASSRHYFPAGMAPEMVEPYSCWAFLPNRVQRLSHKPLPGRYALVVCSGGMDSVVAATVAQREGYEVELIHFRYGSRAEGPEVTAVRNVAQELGVPLHIMPMNVYDPSDSPLLRADSTIAGGEEGAEFAHEWVPARNLVMLALATAFAEAKGFDTIVLGNNLEEAGAYPDNEPEFIERFNDILPFAVGDGKRVRVIMPVGNLMKHEIVALGHEIGAPLHLTWSCYRAGEQHCGTCGPCYMRRKAFEINHLPEVITYENERT